MTCIEDINFDENINEVLQICNLFVKKLGITESNTAIVSDNESTLVSCTQNVLSNIESKGLFYGLLKVYCDQYHQIYMCGTKTMLSLVALWIEEIITLLSQELSRLDLVDGLHYALEQCAAFLTTLSLRIIEKSNEQTNKTGITHMITNFYSRHLTKTKSQLSDGKSVLTSETNDEAGADADVTLSDYVAGLCHAQHPGLVQALQEVVLGNPSSTMALETNLESLTINTASNDLMTGALTTKRFRRLNPKARTGPLPVSTCNQGLFYRNKASANLSPRGKSEFIGDWIDNLHCLCLAGHSTNRFILRSGYWLESSVDIARLIARSSRMKHRLWLINGDLSRTFRHVGHHESAKIQLIANSSDVLFNDWQEDKWWMDLCRNIAKYSITCILLNGRCDPEVKHRLQAEYFVIVFDLVPTRLIKSISQQMGVDLMVYIEEASLNSVVNNVVIHNVTETFVKTRVISTIHLENSQECTTLLIIHPDLQMTHILQEAFFHNLFRVQHSFTSMKVLPGGGQVERQCAAYLERIAEGMLDSFNYNDDCFRDNRSPRLMGTEFTRPIILQAIALGLRKWSDNLDRNLNIFKNGKSDEQPKIYDDPVSKIASWQSAIECIIAFLSVGKLLRTGATSENSLDML